MYSCTKLVALCLTCAAVSTLAVPNAITLQPLSSGSTGGHEVSDATGVVEGRRNDIEILTSHSKNPSKSHSYHSSYEFNARDGWESVPVTDLSYKYGNITNTRSVAGVQRRQQSGIKRGIKVNVNTDAVGGTVSHAVGETWNSIKGLGKAQGVTITWYTGEDLQNPSCWPESDWAPTDASFACALTLEGWTSKPSCLKFLELCNGPDKCIFVRVVDTCAGCKIGSKHVDLTKAAFAELADLDLGILVVQMRMATDPRVWHTDLWGPKV